MAKVGVSWMDGWTDGVNGRSHKTDDLMMVRWRDCLKDGRIETQEGHTYLASHCFNGHVVYIL